MKLANVELSEIRITALYVITCFMCEKKLYLATTDSKDTVGDAADMAAVDGWHSYETAHETCSAACPDCIKEVQENEVEA